MTQQRIFGRVHNVSPFTPHDGDVDLTAMKAPWSTLGTLGGVGATLVSQR